jgi:MoxR-like ATPase
VNALLDGRFNVSSRTSTRFSGALRHRLLFNFEGLAEGVRPDDLIAELIRLVPKPVK